MQNNYANIIIIILHVTRVKCHLLWHMDIGHGEAINDRALIANGDVNLYHF